jgi:hypothetical protein
LILAEKVGCGETTVIQFKKVFKEASDGTKQRCREGDMSIKRAYNSLKAKKPPKKKSKLSIENEKMNCKRRSKSVPPGGTKMYHLISI